MPTSSASAISSGVSRSSACEPGCRDAEHQRAQQQRGLAGRDAQLVAVRLEHLGEPVEQRPVGVDDELRRAGRWSLRRAACACSAAWAIQTPRSAIITAIDLLGAVVQPLRR